MIYNIIYCIRYFFYVILQYKVFFILFIYIYIFHSNFYKKRKNTKIKYK